MKQRNTTALCTLSIVFKCFFDIIVGDFHHWRAVNTYWMTQHDFKPHFSSPLLKRYSIATFFLNLYPFTTHLFLKLCIFLIFTAFDSRFNAVWNGIYGTFLVGIIGVLLYKTCRTNVNIHRGWWWEMTENIVTNLRLFVG